MTDKPTKQNWTKDADGNPVNWTEEPYLVGGLLKLLLEGEDTKEIPRETFKKRLAEYSAIRDKQRADIMKRRSTSGPYQVKPGGGVMKKEPSND